MIGYRKLIVAILMMLLGTITLVVGAIDQETFKWIIASSGVAYLAANSISAFATTETPKKK
jgi:hypothetical protein